MHFCNLYFVLIYEKKNFYIVKFKSHFYMKKSVWITQFENFLLMNYVI